MEPKQQSLIWSRWANIFTGFSIVLLISLLFFVLYGITCQGKLLQNKVNMLSSNVLSLHANLEQTTQADNLIKQNIADLQQMVSGNKEAWRVVEAQYYVKLANNQLLLQDNVPVAIQLLEVADAQIRDLNSPKLDNIRKALANDIAALQAVPAVDYTGLYMRLSALNIQVDQLPILIKTNEKTALPVSSTETTWWKKGLQESWSALQKIVVVRRHEKNIPPLIAPDDQAFVRQNLHAMFEKAMWAVLNKNMVIYQASLNQSMQWIQQYFIIDSAATQGMLSSLKDMEKINIHPQIPVITASLQSFHDYLSQG